MSRSVSQPGVHIREFRDAEVTRLSRDRAADVYSDDVCIAGLDIQSRLP